MASPTWSKLGHCNRAPCPAGSPSGPHSEAAQRCLDVGALSNRGTRGLVRPCRLNSPPVLQEAPGPQRRLARLDKAPPSQALSLNQSSADGLASESDIPQQAPVCVVSVYCAVVRKTQKAVATSRQTSGALSRGWEGWGSRPPPQGRVQHLRMTGTAYVQ